VALKNNKDITSILENTNPPIPVYIAKEDIGTISRLNGRKSKGNEWK